MNKLKMENKGIKTFFICLIPVIALLIGSGIIIQTQLTFQGTIIEVSDNRIIVEVTDGSIANGRYSIAISDHTKIISIHLNHLSSQDLIVGNQVKIFFDGTVFESNPALIMTCYYIWALDD